MTGAGNAAQGSDTWDRIYMVRCAVPQVHAHMAAVRCANCSLGKQNQMNNRIPTSDRPSDQYVGVEQRRMNQCHARGLRGPRLRLVASARNVCEPIQRLHGKMGEVSVNAR